MLAPAQGPGAAAAAESAVAMGSCYMNALAMLLLLWTIRCDNGEAFYTYFMLCLLSKELGSERGS